jgi:hypothetical protein
LEEESEEDDRGSELGGGEGEDETEDEDGGRGGVRNEDSLPIGGDELQGL